MGETKSFERKKINDKVLEIILTRNITNTQNQKLTISQIKKDIEILKSKKVRIQEVCDKELDKADLMIGELEEHLVEALKLGIKEDVSNEKT